MKGALFFLMFAFISGIAYQIYLMVEDFKITHNQDHIIAALPFFLLGFGCVWILLYFMSKTQAAQDESKQTPASSQDESK